MKKKAIKKSLSILVVIIGYFLYDVIPFESQQTDSELNIIYTKHAKCRMECRMIDVNEVKETLLNGKINQRKSQMNKRPCPVIAREFYSKIDNQRIRVVSAECQNKKTIITVIDLGQDHDCYCD